MAEPTWYQVLAGLREYLSGWPALAAADVISGQAGDAPARCEAGPLIEVVRGVTTLPTRTPPLTVDAYRGQQQIDLYAWTWSDDPDPGVGYSLLQALETAMTEAIAAWVNSDPFPEAQISVPLPAFEPDGDIFRPAVASHLPLVVRWLPRQA